MQYFPFLMDLAVQGKIDTSWMFTYVDEFENIAEMYKKFSLHEIPGKLKVCLVTAYGRCQQMQGYSDLPVTEVGI
jgi:threonine dehydrogenase-like Zn-dependent dehydrogenase